MATQEGSTSKVLEGTKIRAAAGRLHSEYPTEWYWLWVYPKMDGL
jgi:hypothetical protein